MRADLAAAAHRRRVEQDLRLALFPQLDRLLAVVPGVPEAQCRERAGGQRVLFQHAELDEVQAGHAWRRRRAVE